ncbi:MAG: hypothetical protein IT480_07635 [Gammaproteobacteria bacterium]|nr:hypothetical protein [Gammaproteobacteria bacterium]
MAEGDSRLLRGLRLPQGTRGELLLALGCLLLGALIVPCLIWVVGRATLGGYTHGSVWALLGDFYAGLVRGSIPFWAVLLGPWALLQSARLGLRLLRWHARRHPS